MKHEIYPGNKKRCRPLTKKLTAIVVCSLFVQSLLGQTFDEWFRQEKTAKKYLREQLAALKMYGDVLDKGYAIAKNGLAIIGNIKRGDFRLHQEYFSSLQSVNPAIQDWPEIRAIMNLQVNLVLEIQTIRAALEKEQYLQLEEKVYVRSLLDNVAGESLHHIDDLLALIHSGLATLKDDQRMLRLESLSDCLQKDAVFLKKLREATVKLGRQRSSDQYDIDRFRQIEGL